MSWLEKLYQTYENCAGLSQFENEPITPVSHGEQQAHIEIVLDKYGKFRSASAIGKVPTLIPMTERSAGRTASPAPHGVCDKIQYCARMKELEGSKESAHDLYVEQLRRWVDFDPNPKLLAILAYVEGGTLIDDLVHEKVLFRNPKGELLTEWNLSGEVPPLFKALPANGRERDPRGALVRWRVEVPGDLESAVWKDTRLQESWIRFDAMQDYQRGLCIVTGEEQPLAINHPKRLRHGGDGAKLVSANDDSGYTYRGRFTTPMEACGIGSMVSQKAHSALRWLIARQAYHDKASGQVVVAWSTGGQPLPELLSNSAEIFQANPYAEQEEGQAPSLYGGDAGQMYSLRLRKLIQGYSSHLDERSDILVMGLDSATPGRMAVTYYREMTGGEFLDRVFRWHAGTAWPQNFGRERHFTGAPAPKDIVEAAYGKRSADKDERLRKASVERLLPCIVDARPIPLDLVESCYRRATQRAGLPPWEFEKCLGITCALYRRSRKEEQYTMSLEEDRSSRDYLFGRLLAIAENIESHALFIAKEQRDTTAARLMQRFADHPAGTWRTIELALRPYFTRLQSARPGVLHKRRLLMDEVVSKFAPGDFVSDARLTAEFLLGYHCQRAAFYSKSGDNELQTDGAIEAQNEGENQ